MRPDPNDSSCARSRIHDETLKELWCCTSTTTTYLPFERPRVHHHCSVQRDAGVYLHGRRDGWVVYTSSGAREPATRVTNSLVSNSGRGASPTASALIG